MYCQKTRLELVKSLTTPLIAEWLFSAKLLLCLLYYTVPYYSGLVCSLPNYCIVCGQLWLTEQLTTSGWSANTLQSSNATLSWYIVPFSILFKKYESSFFSPPSIPTNKQNWKVFKSFLLDYWTFLEKFSPRIWCALHFVIYLHCIEADMIFNVDCGIWAWRCSKWSCLFHCLQNSLYSKLISIKMMRFSLCNVSLAGRHGVQSSWPNELVFVIVSVFVIGLTLSLSLSLYLSWCGCAMWVCQVDTAVQSLWPNTMWMMCNVSVS